MRKMFSLLWIASGWLATVAGATPTPGPGFVQLPSLSIPGPAFTTVDTVGSATFVGIETSGVQSLVRMDTDGSSTTLATGFAGLWGMAYDAVNDRMVVGANGIGPGGAGQTVFGIPDPFGTPLGIPDAAAFRLAPNGTTPFIADVVMDPTDPTGSTLLVANASGPPGGLLRIDVSNTLEPVVTDLQSVPGFAAGLAVDPAAGTIYFGDAFGSAGSRILEVALSTPFESPAQIGGLLSGQFDLALDENGLLFSTSSGDVLRIDPATGETRVVATGFGFATGIDVEDGIIYVLEFGESEIFRFAVPEASTGIYFATGLAFLAAARVKRRSRSTGCVVESS